MLLMTGTLCACVEARPGVGGAAVSQASYHLHYLPGPLGTPFLPPRASGLGEETRQTGNTFALGPVTNSSGAGKSLSLSESLACYMGGLECMCVCVSLVP